MGHVYIWAERVPHARIREFLPGWVQARLTENSSDNVIFLILNLFYSFTVVYQWLISKKIKISKVSEGVQHFPGGGGGGGGGVGPTFSRGVQLFPGVGV